MKCAWYLHSRSSSICVFPYFPLIYLHWTHDNSKFFDFPRRFELSGGDCKKFSHTSLETRYFALNHQCTTTARYIWINLTVFCSSVHNISIFTEHKSIFWFHGDTRVNIASSNSSCIYLYIEASVWDFPVMSMTSPSCLIINNYWTRFNKISRFVGGEQINYLPKPNTEARHWQIKILCDNRIQ